MSCSRNKKVVGGYVNVPNLGFVIGNSKQSSSSSKKDFEQVESYDDFIKKVELLKNENPEVIQYSLGGVLKKIKDNITIATNYFDSVKFQDLNDQEIKNLVERYNIKNYDDIKGFYQQKFDEENNKLEEKKKKCSEECDEKIKNVENKIQKSANDNNEKSKEKYEQEKKDLEEEKNKKLEEISNEQNELKNTKENFDKLIVNIITARNAQEEAKQIVEENPKQKLKNNLLNDNPFTTNVETSINLTKNVQGGTRHKSSNIHTFYKDYINDGATSKGGAMKQVFRL